MFGDPQFFFNWSLSLSIVYVLRKNKKKSMGQKFDYFLFFGSVMIANVFFKGYI